MNIVFVVCENERFVICPRDNYKSLEDLITDCKSLQKWPDQEYYFYIYVDGKVWMKYIDGVDAIEIFASLLWVYKADILELMLPKFWDIQNFSISLEELVVAVKAKTFTWYETVLYPKIGDNEYTGINNLLNEYFRDNNFITKDKLLQLCENCGVNVQSILDYGSNYCNT